MPLGKPRTLKLPATQRHVEVLSQNALESTELGSRIRQLKTLPHILKGTVSRPRFGLRSHRGSRRRRRHSQTCGVLALATNQDCIRHQLAGCSTRATWCTPSPASSQKRVRMIEGVTEGLLSLRKAVAWRALSSIRITFSKSRVSTAYSKPARVRSQL